MQGHSLAVARSAARCAPVARVPDTVQAPPRPGRRRACMALPQPAPAARPAAPVRPEVHPPAGSSRLRACVGPLATASRREASRSAPWRSCEASSMAGPPWSRDKAVAPAPPRASPSSRVASSSAASSTRNEWRGGASSARPTPCRTPCSASRAGRRAAADGFMDAATPSPAEGGTGAKVHEEWEEGTGGVWRRVRDTRRILASTVRCAGRKTPRRIRDAGAWACRCGTRSASPRWAPCWVW